MSDFEIKKQKRYSWI